MVSEDCTSGACLLLLKVGWIVALAIASGAWHLVILVGIREHGLVVVLTVVGLLVVGTRMITVI